MTRLSVIKGGRVDSDTRLLLDRAKAVRETFRFFDNPRDVQRVADAFGLIDCSLGGVHCEGPKPLDELTLAEGDDGPEGEHLFCEACAPCEHGVTDPRSKCGACRADEESTARYERMVEEGL